MRPEGPVPPSAAELLGLGVLLASSVFVPMGVGAVVDGVLRTGPAFLLLGLAVGVGLALAVAYTRFKRYL